MVAAHCSTASIASSNAPFQWFSRMPQQRSIGLYLLWSCPSPLRIMTAAPRATDQPTHTVDVPMIEEHLHRSTCMELHTRVELIDMILEEADQKMQALHHALAAQARAKDERQHAGQDTSLSQEGATLKYEQDLWQRVCTSLT